MKCPPFTLLASDEKEYSLSSFNTTKVLFFIYPKDNTPGCTGENKDFTALQSDFKNLDITLVGVSPDSVSSHQSFIEKQDLSVLLLSDPEKVLIEGLGAWGEKKNYGKTYVGLIRSTFLVDRESGEVEKEWRNVRAKGHAQRILKEVSV